MATQCMAAWPLHDIVTTNLVRCMAYKREVGGVNPIYVCVCVCVLEVCFDL